MIDYDLKKTIKHIEALIHDVNSADVEDMFDSLAIIELAARNAISDHAASVLLKGGQDEFGEMMRQTPPDLTGNLEVNL